MCVTFHDILSYNNSRVLGFVVILQLRFRSSCIRSTLITDGNTILEIKGAGVSSSFFYSTSFRKNMVKWFSSIK
jgi:hypothetical protein